MLGNILVYDRVVTRTFTRNLNIDIRDCNIGQKIFLIKYLKYQNIINNNIIEWSSQVYQKQLEAGSEMLFSTPVSC